MENELWVLTRIIDDSDPNFDLRTTTFGPPEVLSKLFCLDPLPPGWSLLKGKEAEAFLISGIRDEMRWQSTQKN